MISPTRLRWRRFVVAMLMVIALIGPTLPVRAFQVASPETATALVAESEATLAFPSGIDIESTLHWDGDLTGLRLDLLYRVSGNDSITLASSRQLDGGTSSTWSEMGRLDLQAHYLPVGLDISWWWRLVGDDGIVAESAPELTRWYDDQWSWETIESDQVILHEYALSDDFAQEVLAVIQETFTDLETRYGIESSTPVSVWIYDTRSDFEIAKPPNSRETIAALSYPSLQLIVSILTDGDDRELLRVLPHEVSHHVLAQATANPYSSVPLWFDEGLATHVQTGGTDGYMSRVVNAHADGQLFNLNSLTASFPYMPSQATLAYATSWSAIAYISETYGDEGIARLVDAFAAGLPYADAISQALGVDSATLNDNWMSWVAAQ